VSAKVSIVIPLYNKAPYIGRALDSIRAQTFGDYEVIVVDDGSTDGGSDLVIGYGDARIRLVRQANAGPGPARNRGISEAASPFVTFLDADDEWMPSFLEKSLGLLDHYGPEVACVTSSYLLEALGRSMTPVWRKRGLSEGVVRLSAATPPRLAVHLLAFLCPWSTVARVETVRKWGGFYGKGKCLYGEDSYLWLKVMLNETLAINLEPLVHYHTEASGLARNTRGPRPVEPILTDPGDLFAACPPPLQELLRKILAIRALKTACVLGYWGRWREGRNLLKRFCSWSAWRLPHFGTAQICASPLGAMAGAVMRSLQAAT